MKLIIIRHADPDYSIDSLTEKGWQEAELLSQRLIHTEMTAIYTSPLGRAKDTASPTLKKLGRQAEILPWLEEVDAPIVSETRGPRHIPWDWIPQEWTAVEAFYDKDKWHTVPVMARSNVFRVIEGMHQGLDQLLEKHGYVRDGNLYKAIQANEDTIVLFCHFGTKCVLLGHLLGISPMVLWHTVCAQPSSVTTLVTEERREGIAAFRMLTFGDTAHLYVANEDPSFAGRFCETYANKTQRHD